MRKIKRIDSFCGVKIDNSIRRTFRRNVNKDNQISSRCYTLFSCKSLSRDIAAEQHHVIIDPLPLDNILHPNVLTLRKKWFVNLTGTDIPDVVIGLLQLGSGFGLPPTNVNNTVLEIIKCVENSIIRNVSGCRKREESTQFLHVIEGFAQRC